MVDAHRRLVERFVRRYAGRGIARDDLRQTALLALVQAADRFDPDRGVAFETYAGSTIDGTLKRCFRDTSWTVRPPRRLQELHLRVRRADEELGHRLGHHPTVAEIARHLGEDVDDVHLAVEAGGSHASMLVSANPRDDGAGTEQSWMGAIDHGFDGAEARAVLHHPLERLDDRQRELLRLRFAERLTQREIGERLGFSQSYLSRLLHDALGRLRAEIAS